MSIQEKGGHTFSYNSNVLETIMNVSFSSQSKYFQSSAK